MRLFFISDDIFHTAIQDLAKIVDLGGTYAVSLFHAVDRCAADIVLMDERIRRDPFPLQRLPKRSIAYHVFIIKACYFLDNTHNYDYNGR